MTVLVVSFLFFIIISITTEKCDASKPRKESSITSLSLTAPRSDEGIWITRFGEYEVSIELRSHNMSSANEPEDTWTVKIKHKTRKFTSEEDLTENDDDVDGSPFKKMQMPDKKSKQKSRRQLSSKSKRFEENKNLTLSIERDSNLYYYQDVKDSNGGGTLEGLHNTDLDARNIGISPKNITNIGEINDTSSQKLGGNIEQQVWEQDDVKQLVQGTKRYTVVFSNDSNDANQRETNEFQQLNENEWGKVDALVSESFPLEQQHQSVAEEAPQTEVLPNHESLSGPYVLPLQQNLQHLDDSAIHVTEKTDKENLNSQANSAALHEYGKVTDNYENNNSKKSYISDTFDNTHPKTYIESDYVIEDTIDRNHDKNDNNYDYEDASYTQTDNQEKNYGDFKLTSEIKRILDWYPRSKPLTVQNNGYKYFPHVGWFKLITWPERWSRARNVCESDLAHLAIPDTKEKVQIFLEIFKNYPDVLEKSILSKQVYVGVYNAGSEGNFTTVLERPFRPNFPIWFENEPDNAAPGEDCVTFHAKGKIRDVPCFFNLPFLCEKWTAIS